MRSLCQRMRWHSSAMILIATFGSRRGSEKIFAPQHEQFAGFARGRIRSAALAVQHRDFTEQVARPHEVQGQPAAVGGAGLDTDLAPAHAEQRVARIALLEQHLAVPQMLGVAEIRQPLELVCAEIGEHRVHLQDDRKFGLLAHFNVLVNLVWQIAWNHQHQDRVKPRRGSVP